MRHRFLLVGTLAGTLALFGWQAVANAALPFHAMTLTPFADDAAVSRTIRAHAPTNGVYVARQGLLAVVAFTPDMADRSRASMAPMLARQLVIDLVVVFLLALVVLRLAEVGVARTATTLGMGGLAASLVIHLSDWNWYGFGAAYELVNVVDQTIAFGITGAVLGALAQRHRRAQRMVTEERPAAGVRTREGLRPSRDDEATQATQATHAR